MANKRSAEKRSTAKDAGGKNTAKKAPGTAPAKKASAKKASAKKAAGGKTSGGKTPGGKTPGGKTPGGKTPGGKTPGGKTAGKSPSSKKTPKTPGKPGKPGKTGREASAGAKKPPKVRRVGAGKTAASEPPPPPSSRRNFGLRGAAPWVARHAAKHAEELRKRNAEPPPPGSARATLRTPAEAEQIKNKIAELHQRISKIRNLRKKLDKSFYEIGELLAEVQALDLYEAKGYSSFESFLDREVDLPRGVSLRLIRFTHTFVRETAYDFGIERLTAALAALDGEISPAAPSHPSSRGWSGAGLPVKPPIRFDD